MSSAGARTRAEAARVVQAVLGEGRSLDAALAGSEPRLAAGQRSLLRALAYGVLRFHWRLEARVNALLERPLQRRDRVVGTLLALGIFQLEDMRIPSHAAVSETVEAARLLGRRHLAALVNAVLRRSQREPAGPLPDSETLRWNHPEWMIARLRRDWPRHWQDILGANNRQAPMWLRVNARRSDAAAYLERLSGEGFLEPGIDQALRLAAPCAVEELPGFAAGDVSVQDGAAQLAAPWLLAGGGGPLLDLCAAPGGKAAHLLELAGPSADLTAVEIDPGRAALVEETLARLGLEATVRVADASKLEAWWDGGRYDRILVDAPCSASGVIRRHPDIKHLRRPGDVAALAAAQASLLDAAWETLRPGGRLLYVTCSVFEAENDAVVRAFAARHTDAETSNLLPNNNIRALMVATAQGFQVLPGTKNLDGFFFACLEKRG